MMKIVSTFNVHSAGSYQVRQVVAQFREIEGVQDVCLLQAVEGKPHYALEITCEDETLDSVISQLQRVTRQYSAYVSDLERRTFRQLT